MWCNNNGCQAGHNGFMLSLNLHNQGYTQINPTPLNKVKCKRMAYTPLRDTLDPGAKKVREESGVGQLCVSLGVRLHQLGAQQVWWTCGTLVRCEGFTSTPTTIDSITHGNFITSQQHCA